MELEPIRERFWRDVEWTNADIWKRRVSGKTVEAISNELEISVAAVQQALENYVDQRPVESDQVAKALQIDRLDALFGLAVEAFMAGETKVLPTAVKISESMRGLLGINAPDKREISLTSKTELDEHIESMIREMEDF